MSIYVRTQDPRGLVNKIKKAIDDKSIDTWSYDKDGDFTHSVSQWAYHAWIRPRLETDRVVFSIICRNDKNLSVTDYAVYHGRFAEMLLTHFDKTCKSIEITPLATNYDLIKSQK